MLRTAYGGLKTGVRGPPRPNAQLVTERGRAEPARLRHIEHDAVRSGPLHLDVALCTRPDAERLLDVVTAARPRCGEPLRDRLEALDLKADVVDAGEVLAALAARRRVVLEIQDARLMSPSVRKTPRVPGSSTLPISFMPNVST